MNGPVIHPPTTRGGVSWALLVARWIVGAFFIYSGFIKAMEPAEFLKLLRMYELTAQPVLLNPAAAVLPWFEMFCGALLILGIAVRGTVFVLACLLVVFTAVLVQRALGIQEATGLVFCAIRFDCGCGTGEVAVCRKIVENAVLFGLNAWLLLGRRSRGTLWGG
jgi:uncharacterized membrane protein YphA (DoxX/SURF4 family)